MVMPGGVTGTELLAKVKAKHPNIKRLFTSGYAGDIARPNDGTLWLRKPYTLKEMSETFRKILG